MQMGMGHFIEHASRLLACHAVLLLTVISNAFCIIEVSLSTQF